MKRFATSKPGFCPASAITAAVIAIGSVATLSGCEQEATEGGLIRVDLSIGEIGSSPGQFQYPRALAVVPEGVAGSDHPSLIVIDKTARVQRFDADSGQYLGEFRMPEWGLGKPTGIGIGPHPNDPTRVMLWVADTHYHRILVYDVPDSREGNVEPVFGFGTYGTEPGQFIYPTDVEIITNELGAVSRVLVSEYGGNDRITVFEIDQNPESQINDVTLIPIATIGRFGNAGEDDVGPSDSDRAFVLHRPQDLAFDPSHSTLIITDSLNHRILRVRLEPDGSGTLIDAFGGPDRVGRALGQLDHPYSTALLADGTVMVSEFGACRVQRVNLDTGESMGSFGVPGRRVGELINPWEIAVVGQRAWVLDSGNNRVVGFTSPERGL